MTVAVALLENLTVMVKNGKIVLDWGCLIHLWLAMEVKMRLVHRDMEQKSMAGIKLRKWYDHQDALHIAFLNILILTNMFGFELMKETSWIGDSCKSLCSLIVYIIVFCSRLACKCAFFLA